MKEYIEREALLETIDTEREELLAIAMFGSEHAVVHHARRFIEEAPAADVVEVETLKSWLYEIAMNNVGCHVDDFASACEEIISRVGGLMEFAKDKNN